MWESVGQHGGQHGVGTDWRGGLAAGGEEFSEEGGGFGFADPADDFRGVVAGWRGEDAGAVVHAAAFGVIGAENQFSDPGEGDGLGAHRAGFQGDVEVAADQAGGADDVGGGADGQNLGMGGGVAVYLRLVAGLGEDGAVRADDDGADRDFASGGGGGGFFQGAVHRGHANFLLAYGVRV